MLDPNRLQRFQSKPYRGAYVTNRVRTAIATQIRVLREQFSPTQKEFAEKIGKKQSVVSRLENPAYGKMSVNTLLEIAEALDITLVVKFMSYDDFFTLLDDEDASPEALRVETFSETTRRREGTPDHPISQGLRDAIEKPKDQAPAPAPVPAIVSASTSASTPMITHVLGVRPAALSLIQATT